MKNEEETHMQINDYLVKITTSVIFICPKCLQTIEMEVKNEGENIRSFCCSARFSVRSAGFGCGYTITRLEDEREKDSMLAAAERNTVAVANAVEAPRPR